MYVSPNGKCELWALQGGEPIYSTFPLQYKPQDGRFMLVLADTRKFAQPADCGFTLVSGQTWNAGACDFDYDSQRGMLSVFRKAGSQEPEHATRWFLVANGSMSDQQPGCGWTFPIRKD
jgi:hypothetical protein